ncbi:type I DNA topoisomerase [Deinococcus maricopensis]|uniref:DNA topoisomerase 1 n=1 Tax=Deinococcus maricopensis (strain DSM 21211 / LMG 22137 / NRRL B-23946 / LB-34) TaxID=709986 RepID=E8U4S6_DEIML|nr:type I DNA topoisomerase [Deinococcus maricopensis]ADV66065.1 DNA topoisomerase I [Deinococcus maricopensis DSM 21211]
MSTLVIVESPSKAKKIQAYLGAGYTVRASLGHIRDLPASKADIPARYAAEPWARLGIHVQDSFRPLYVISRGKAKVVRELRELARGANRVLLATDPDREGEAIAWHLMVALGLKGSVERMTFHEITREAIQAAARATRPLDYALVGAQEARRTLDRLVGYGVSPTLWTAVGPKLSAGRVQSAALAALAAREHARMAFVPADYWRVTARVGAGRPFTAVVLSVNGQRLATPKDFDAGTGQLAADALLMTPEQADRLVAFLRARDATVTGVERAPYTSRPPAPFTTSTLQQEASKALKFSPKHSMDVAQRLYENGFITYMRTDSPALSDEALQAAREAATALFSEGSVPARPRTYAARGANAQEAHEAIRPAGRSFRAPDDTPLTGDERALYDLIYRRTVASQMTDLTGTRTVMHLKVGAVALGATGRVVHDPGFTRLYQDASEGDGDETQALPDAEVGAVLPVRDAAAEERKTPAPGRFTEASLVRALERAGVGRPSTYASILSTLDARGYTRVVRRQLTVTWVGLLVSAYLAGSFADLVDAGFTASMEADLDRIAGGALTREAYLTRFWSEGLAGTIGRAGRAAPVLTVPRVPGATVTVQDGTPLLRLHGRSAPLPADLVPDDLTPDVAEQVLNGERKAAQRASGGKRARSGGARTSRARSSRKAARPK